VATLDASSAGLAQHQGPHKARAYVLWAIHGHGARQRRSLKLQLPEGARLHNVFHVGVLKKFHGTPPVTPGQLLPIKHGQACVVPEEVSKSHLARGRRQLLVRWKGQDTASSSWVDVEEFQSLYPTFELTDELILQGGRDVMWGRVYSRRDKRANKDQVVASATKPGEARVVTP
jgi:hypothetical protein